MHARISVDQAVGAKIESSRVPVRLALAALALFALAPIAQAAPITISFSGTDVIDLNDQENGGEIFGGVELRIDGSFQYDSSGIENPMNPGEYVAVASSPQIIISVRSFYTLGTTTPEQVQAIQDFASLFPLFSTLPFSNAFGANDVGEANVSPAMLSFAFPSTPGNNTLALLEVLYLDLTPIGTFGSATLAGATQSLLDAGNPLTILSAAAVTYSGPLNSGEYLEAVFVVDAMNVAVVPLPATAWLLAAGLAALAPGFRRRTR